MTARKIKQNLNCFWCEKELHGQANQKYCSKECGVSYRTKFVYRYKYTYSHRNKSPENFLKTLLTKKKRSDSLTVDVLLDLCEEQNWLCALSGEKLTFIAGQGKVNTNASIDQIEPGKGYTKNNIQIVCRILNTMKYDSTYEEFINWCKKVIDNDNRKGKLDNSRVKVISKAANRRKQPKRDGSED